MPRATALSKAAHVVALSALSSGAISATERGAAVLAMTTSYAKAPDAPLMSDSRKYPSTAEEPHRPNT